MTEGLSHKDQRTALLNGALAVAEEVRAERVFVFLHTDQDIEWFVQAMSSAQPRYWEQEEYRRCRAGPAIKAASPE